ncbi:MAG: VWA domain-containing protein [Gemmataceae bacterium]|nr:VWA domain-containing protein [Gemmataceae bacterium]
MRCALIAALCLVPATQAAPVPLPKKVNVEVVFCLDTTGSMSGLIDGAKAKIWSICNQIASGKPTPDLKVGLVAYRDKGDAYVTKVTDLSSDLDAIHKELKTYTADGGGDEPEHVNQALYDAVHKIKWSADKKTLKIVFLVGDAAPHMDYTDDVKYPETCKKAVEKGIIINTVLCGTSDSAKKAWVDISDKAKGSFVAIPQDGGVVIARTPFDEKMEKLNGELTKTVLVWGGREKQQADREKNEASLGLKGDSAAGRIAYQAKNAQAAAYCLADQVKRGEVKLEAIKKEELPAELKKLDLKGQKEYLKKLDDKRADLNKQVLELDKERSAWIAKKTAEEAKKGKGGFDVKVLEVLRKQAKGFELDY